MRRAQGSQSGKRLGRYTLHERLGGDRVHEAYLAVGDSSAVRVRVLRPEVALNPTVIDRFVDAPRSLCGVSHPNLARIEAVETDDLGIPFVIEELCEGTTLRQYLKAHPPPLPAKRVAELLVPVCDALAHAHAREVVHGRLSPDEVTLTGEPGAEEPKVTGFGSVQDIVSDASTIRPASQYVAPELARGTEEPGVYSDVWSLGVLLYELLAGRAPAQLYSRVQVGDRVSSDAPLQAAPAELRALIDACLTADPHARLPSATILRDRLRAVADQPEPAPALGNAGTERPPAADSDDDEPEILLEAATDADPDTATATATATEAEAEAEAEAPAPAPAVATAATVVAAAPAISSAVKAPKAMTLSAVAAAFASVEKVSAGVGQQEAEATRARPTPAPERPSRRKSNDAGLLSASARQELGPSKPRTPSPRDLKSNHKAAAAAMDAATMERLRKLSRDEDRGGGWLRAVLFVLFCLMLMFSAPYLVDPEPARLQAVLGDALKPALLGMTVLGVGVLIGLWSMQVQSKAALLKPLLWCMKALAMCLGGVTASWMLPGQGLGPIGFMAHRGLPWVSAAFFLFLMLWAMSRGLAQLKASMLSSAGALLLSALSAFGGYRVVRQAIVEPMRAQLAAREDLGEQDDPVDEAQGDEAARVEEGMMEKLTGMLGGGVDLSEEAAAIEAEGEGAGEVRERTQAGASEADDLKSVEDLEKSRKATQRQVEMLKNLAPNAAK